MHAIVFPDISPIAFTILGFAVYWYSFAYIIGLGIGYFLFQYLNRHAQALTPDAIDDLLFYSVLGLVIGARLGFSLFYDLPHTLAEPLNIFMIRQGGMSFHGGLLGIMMAVYWVSRKYKVKFLRITDLVVCVAPIGLFLGRIANFINAEIYGRVTTLSWGVIFPRAGPLPRHPTQIYEALGEGIILFIILILCFPRLHTTYGKLSGLFLIIYGLIRIPIEILKEGGAYDTPWLTMGQLLCIPMILLGTYLFFRPPLVLPPEKQL